MNIYLFCILAYLLVLLGFNFYRARQIKNQEDFMVAGRSLSIWVMVFTLICTWIGSGTFVAGAEFAYRAGLSALWLALGAWVGIILIYFLAAKILCEELKQDAKAKALLTHLITKYPHHGLTPEMKKYLQLLENLSN